MKHDWSLSFYDGWKCNDWIGVDYGDESKQGDEVTCEVDRKSGSVKFLHN